MSPYHWLAALAALSPCCSTSSKLRASAGIPGVASIDYEGSSSGSRAGGDGEVCYLLTFFDEDGDQIGPPIMGGDLPIGAPVPKGSKSVTVTEVPCPDKEKPSPDDREQLVVSPIRLALIAPAAELDGFRDRFAAISAPEAELGGVTEELRKGWMYLPPPSGAEVHYAFFVSAVSDGLLIVLGSDERMERLDLLFNGHRHVLRQQFHGGGWYRTLVLVPWSEVDRTLRAGRNDLSFTLDTEEEQGLRFEGSYEWPAPGPMND
jgi:hypothetical protein